MPQSKIDKLIINSPYEEPEHHWKYDRETRLFSKEPGRRPAGYVVATEGSKAFDDPGQFIEIAAVNQIRPRIKAWRESGYVGVTGITRKLLEHWYDPEARDHRRFFFCQLEAIETLIWLAEAPKSQTVGLEISTNGGEFTRLCSKMATGSGKTIVMAMLIAWQVLNKVTYPQNAGFSKNFFVVAPGLTVKKRLQVLIPSSPGNYYDEFNIIPPGLMDKLRQGKILIRNWHALSWDTEERLAKKKTVDKRGAKSDEAYVRDVLGDMANARNIIVINDEAHHAWRVPAESKIKGVKKEDIEAATVWISGLDRINAARQILNCYDFSATPFAPSGKKSSEEALFTWIVSDFGLNDAIESGLVKTPRVVIRDDGEMDVKSYKSKLYHIYVHVKDDLNRKAEEHEPLPDLVTNAYYLLAKDWLETLKNWQKAGHKIPPVMITVANRTETAARVKYAFDHKRIRIDELCDPTKILHIDSKVLDEAESQEELPVLNNDDIESGEEDQPERKLTKKELAELLRQTVDTVGKIGKPGEHVQKVISVGMLSEGWDAKTVTHIMGLRAFSSQLLCEQVVGRGLRRTSYDINKETGLFEAEYVNIFGVPFTFLPHESKDGPPPPPSPPKTRIEAVIEKQAFEISWPNIIRIDHVFRPTLSLDISAVNSLGLNAYETRTLADLAPVVEGKPDVTRIAEIDLADLAKRYRMQKIIFETARDVYEQMKPDKWRGNKEYLLAQVIGIVEQFIRSEKVKIFPPIFWQHEDKKRILLTLNMNKIVQHIWENIIFNNTESLTVVFDNEKPIKSTGDMPTWFTGKPCEYAKRSHINHCVYDSTWEASEAYELDRNKHVDAWVKNDHLGFEILYLFDGMVRKYRPDFIIRLRNGAHLVLEVKGVDSQQNKTKRAFLDEWIRAVNAHGGFGTWKWAVSYNPRDVEAILDSIL
ncbi:MAG: type III restriction endonuclease subunit R [candidate division Zixibacteria bacterium HGW-Zixibacteria-1]|nr:MAG: type III restriction endonuclease subunit R [candidate division Zixibacteria bacterium HGW-Zixibacteria-1]